MSDAETREPKPLDRARAVFEAARRFMAELPEGTEITDEVQLMALDAALSSAPPATVPSASLAPVSPQPVVDDEAPAWLNMAVYLEMRDEALGFTSTPEERRSTALELLEMVHPDAEAEQRGRLAGRAEAFEVAAKLAESAAESYDADARRENGPDGWSNEAVPLRALAKALSALAQPQEAGHE